MVVEPASVQEAADVIAACHGAGQPVRLLGLGSDLLVADAGLPEVIVRFAERFSDVVVEGSRVTVQAGASMPGRRGVCAAGLAGYEFASGIPGTIGGAHHERWSLWRGVPRRVLLACVRHAAGAYREPSCLAGMLGYRHSMMGDAGWAVLSATLQLRPDSPSEIRARMDDLAQRRAEKQPLEMPSAGSTFKRPVGYFAGKLIQDAGLRGFRVGGAQVSEKHTGFVVNAGGATARDVRDLIAEVQRRVYEMEGVRMYPEVRMWGFEAKNSVALVSKAIKRRAFVRRIAAVAFARLGVAGAF